MVKQLPQVRFRLAMIAVFEKATTFDSKVNKAKPARIAACTDPITRDGFILIMWRKVRSVLFLLAEKSGRCYCSLFTHGPFDNNHQLYRTVRYGTFHLKAQAPNQAPSLKSFF